MATAGVIKKHGKVTGLDIIVLVEVDSLGCRSAHALGERFVPVAELRKTRRPGCSLAVVSCQVALLGSDCNLSSIGCDFRSKLWSLGRCKVTYKLGLCNLCTIGDCTLA